MVDYISIPSTVHILPNWLDTPNFDEDKVNDVAQTYFKDWNRASLDTLNFAIKMGKVTALIGIGVSIYFLSIPSIIICGTGLTLCILGAKAILRENVLRGEAACLELENWFVLFNQACQNFQEQLKLCFLSSDDDLTQEQLENLSEAMREFPTNDLKNLVQNVKEAHFTLFGKKRRIEGLDWNDWWIERIDKKLSPRLGIVYSSRSFLENKYLCFEMDEKQIKEFKGHSKLIFEYLSPPTPKFKTPSEVRLEQDVMMYLLSDRTDLLPQGKENFATLVEEIEYWRENVAIFRSSFV